MLHQGQAACQHALASRETHLLLVCPELLLCGPKPPPIDWAMCGQPNWETIHYWMVLSWDAGCNTEHPMAWITLNGLTLLLYKGHWPVIIRYLSDGHKTITPLDWDNFSFSDNGGTYGFDSVQFISISLPSMMNTSSLCCSLAYVEHVKLFAYSISKSLMNSSMARLHIHIEEIWAQILDKPLIMRGQCNHAWKLQSSTCVSYANKADKLASPGVVSL